MKYLFLDVDGTLINYNTQLPKSAKQAVEKAQKNGHKVIICTGCSRCEIESRAMDLKFDGVIYGNGCYVEYNQEVIFHRPLSLEQCAHFVNWCNQRDLAFRLECNDGMFLSEGYEEKSKEARYKYIYGHGEYDPNKPLPPLSRHMVSGQNLLRDDVNKTAFILKSYQDFLDAKEEFKDMTVDTWGGKGELALYGATRAKGFDKENSIHLLLDKLNVDPKDAIAFGDGVVDIPMFKACGFSVAMANGNNEVKNAVDYVTDDVDQDGLYKAFEYLKLI